MKSNNNTTLNHRNFSDIPGFVDMLLGLNNGMPADTPLISITEAHRNVINIVYNNREEDAIIRSNFLNDNEVVNEINFVIERNNACIP